MKRDRILVAGLLLSLAAGPALAETRSLTAAIEAQLRQQGFTSIVVSTTWLGRTQIDAASPSQKREIVINPRTGEILRDYWHPVSDATAAINDILDSRSNGTGSQGAASSDGSSDGSAAGSDDSGSSGSTSSGSSSGSSSGGASSGSGSSGGDDGSKSESGHSSDGSHSESGD